MPKSNANQNHLSQATSPYLLQHADNPVHWHEWDADALQRARDEQRPILLSIGYSACHWCHVMAHESFEDDDTAALMNALFVNIKVDREERPDLDQIYQKAHQLLSQRPGGWPLTVFLSPDDQMPFFAGTYFPPTARHGLPAFKDLLRHLDRAYREQADDIREQNSALQAALSQLEPPAGGAVSLSRAPWDGLRQQLTQSFDARFGGFGQAPKFPHPGNLDNLLSLWERNGDSQARHMACFTLEKMADGGMNDQIGGGFCRYSVDEQWMIPHFEKMLYDNAQLLPLYARAERLCPDRGHAQTAQDTVDWLLREMQSPEGGFYSALDADSEGEEGRFYVWQQDELKTVLGALYPLAAQRWGFDRGANFEGSWHAHVYTDLTALGDAFGQDRPHIERQLREARQRLFAARAPRVRPGLDNKILSAWNGLMIGALASAGRVLNQPAWIDAAQRANQFITDVHWQDGRLLATSKDGQARLPAYLDDHAFLLQAQLALLQAHWSNDTLAMAQRLADTLLDRFEDPQRGGFFFTAHDHERLIERPRKFSDDATPAGNGIATSALLQLGYLLGEARYIEAAERTLRAAWPSLAQMPHAHNSLLAALDIALDPPTIVVLRGADSALPAWQEAVDATVICLAIPSDTQGLTEALASKPPPETGVRAYWCQGHHCEPPISDLADFQAKCRPNNPKPDPVG